MARQKKEGESRTFKLRQEILDKLDKYSEETMMPKTAVVEKALEEYFDKQKVKL